VAAARMRRTQQQVLASRPYSLAMRELIGELASQGSQAGADLHPLLAQREIDTVGVIVITPDRGQVGPLNGNIIRKAVEVVLEAEERDHKAIELITVGRKGQDFFARRGRKLLGTFTGLVDRGRYDDVIPVARVVMDSYAAGVMDRCYLVYPRFISTLVQRPEVVQLLPIQSTTAPEADATGAPKLDYIYEPDPNAILEDLLPRYVEVQIYQALLETAASEQSARMVAMRNATDNAKELASSLTLTYNKVRQSNITREVTEIASAAEAMAAAAR
jgi:F-type H+-transporting ATPase subunit gamma